ncbi:MAG TPA: hypothetical protein ENJ50_08390, partial [Planctomycetaceae bacterium]|nr:hypothetical protein [Planctomycetaceae bacterium]
MSRRYVWATVWALLLLGGASTGSVATAQEIGFRETYALAEDRAAVLKRLVPGTEDYYYYHCLYYQQTQQFPRVETLLAEWEKKRGRTALWKVIRNRQALLTYSDHPAKTIEYLRRELGLAFADHGWTSNGSTPRFPSRLDPSLIDRDTIARNLLKNPRTLSSFNETAHYWLATWKLTPYQRHVFLAQLKRPDVPGLVAMIDEDLRSRMTAGFGRLDIHKRLTRQQMDELAKRNPTVLSQARFVQEYLKRLVPSVDERPDSDETQKRHLDRLWKFVQTLPPVHNSLKAHVLYHRLKFDLQHDKFDKASFLAYLKLPRLSPHVNPQFLRQPDATRYLANLGAKFDEFTLRPPIGDDRSLIQAYLEHFFQKETTFDEYLPYLKDSFVRRVFAETKVLYGLGDPQEWTKYLSPAEYTEISERVELRFAPTNRKQFGVSDPVSLELDVKNVPTLLVKVYRINTWNYYRTHKKHVPTDIDLEGLVPTWEQRHVY